MGLGSHGGTKNFFIAAITTVQPKSQPHGSFLQVTSETFFAATASRLTFSSPPLLPGVKSVLMVPRPEDDCKTGFVNWPILTLKHWGESPLGEWKFEVIDTVSRIE